ncbi:MAG: family transcriptional regulator [Microvirga sp.]|jgi:DNA-binding XRE family transcriptional regulator|nr:family transcriptional regulator [Microvirga sp.]
MIRPQIIERDGEPQFAVIPIAEWRQIEAMLEKFEDIRDFDAALAKPDRRMIPFEVTSAILDGASPIRAWREHRGLSQSDLAQAAGMSVPQLAEVEDGPRRATPATLRRVAKALRAQVDDLTG